ncbi:Transcription factor unc-86 [Dinochytrium kinnereticum]|nr:Transcription factor unc-86 [Dinochytrium kinnereticum]
MLCGLIIEYFSVFGWIGKFEDNRACDAQQWIGWIGFSVLMQGVLPKCWRIFRIFDNKKVVNTMKYLQDHNLVMLSIPISAINFIIIGVWVGTDPLKAVYVSKTSADFHYECRSKNINLQDAFNYALMTYNGLLIAAAILLAYLTRNASSSYRETAFILYACQNILICSVVVIALVYSSGGSFLATLYLRLVLTWTATTVAYAMTVGRTALAVVFDISATAPARGRSSSVSSNGAGSKTGKEDGKRGEQSGLLDAVTMANGAPTSFAITVPVKDGGRTLSKWETKKVFYVQSHKCIMLMDKQTGVGEVFQTGQGSPTRVYKSTIFPESIEIRSGGKHRILQLPDTNAVERFAKCFEPASAQASANKA